MTEVLITGESAERIPDGPRAAPHRDAPQLRTLALALQRRDSTAISDMLGLILAEEGGSFLGVGTTTELLTKLRLDLPAALIERLERFVTEPCPAAHLRVFALFRTGHALLRLDMLPMRAGSQA